MSYTPCICWTTWTSWRLIWQEGEAGFLRPQLSWPSPYQLVPEPQEDHPKVLTFFSLFTIINLQMLHMENIQVFFFTFLKFLIKLSDLVIFSQVIFYDISNRWDTEILHIGFYGSSSMHWSSVQSAKEAIMWFVSFVGLCSCQQTHAGLPLPERPGSLLIQGQSLLVNWHLGILNKLCQLHQA